MRNITYIYLVENCFGDPNKVYIGKTKTTRKSNHEKTYGNKINYTIIDKINSLNHKDWKPLECYWIEQFRQWGFDVQNKNKGGGGSDSWNDNQKLNHSLLKKGVPLLKLRGKPSKRKGEIMSADSCNLISKKAKQRYDEGKMYFPLQNPESAKKSGLSKKGKKQSKEHIQKRIEQITGQKRSEEAKLKISQKKKEQTYYNDPKFIKRMTDANKKPILQFDLSGNFIKEWECMGDVLKHFGKGDLTYACKDFNRSSNGYKWKYK